MRIPGLIEDNVKITLMWNEGRGIEIPCESLKSDLEMEMKNYLSTDKLIFFND